MTAESDFQTAVKHPALRQDFLHSLDLGEFGKCVSTIQYRPNSLNPYQFMSSDIKRAFLSRMPAGLKYPIEVYSAAFERIDGKGRLFDDFLSILDHELFHCWDASTHPERFQVKINFAQMSDIGQLQYLYYTAEHAECELRALAYEESKLNGRNVSEQHKKMLKECKNDWQTILDNYRTRNRIK